MSEQTQALEISIETAKEGIAKNDALNRLSRNKDFQLLIDTGYFRDTAARLVLLRGAPQMQDEANQTGLLREMDAIAYLRQYFSTIAIQGAQMSRTLQADLETQEAIENGE